MNIYEQIINRKTYISIIGLGYVGIPLVVAFSKKINVIAFDIDKEKVDLYKRGIDVTNEVGNDALTNTKAIFTSDEEELKKCLFHIIAVPTPINNDYTPNLQFLKQASKIVGKNLKKNSVVVYESTVYPGVTEEVCIPILEKESLLKCGVDFKVGYSPERINPGDKLHRFETISKVVSGIDDYALDTIAKVYKLVIKANVCRAKSIRIAEAAKVIENCQRDINIAFINELSLIFNRLGIDTLEVLKVAKTKWNFLDFTPGLVGGHCIGVDPYYLTYKAQMMGYHSEIILSGRRINDSMGKFVATNTVKSLIKADVPIKKSKVLIMGITFKENCPDIRNSKVIDIIKELNEYGLEVAVTDPLADPKEVYEKHNIILKNLDEIRDVKAVIITVKHDQYRTINLEIINEIITDSRPVLIDVKGLFNKEKAEDLGYLYWRL